MGVPLYTAVTLGAPRRVVCSDSFIATLCEHAPSVRLPSHGHTRLSICHVLRGGYVEGGLRREVDCGIGATIAKLPQQEHWNHVGSQGCLSVAIEVKDEALATLGEALPNLMKIGEAPLRPPSDLIRCIWRELERVEIACPRIIEDAAIELVAALCPDPSRRRRSQRPAWLDRVRDFLDAEACRSPRLTSLAAAAGVHHVHLARSFRRYFGLTVGEYARRLRAGRAQRLLEAGDLSIAEIAALTGFADQAHLTRVLRRLVGATPGALRRTQQSGTRPLPEVRARRARQDTPRRK